MEKDNSFARRSKPDASLYVTEDTELVSWEEPSDYLLNSQGFDIAWQDNPEKKES
jgi:hypothetical protein